MQYTLAYPEEFLTKISGYYGRYQDDVIIESLRFETNTCCIPCGTQARGTYFEIDMDGQIVGLHGRSSADFVYSIGAYTLLKGSPKQFCYIDKTSDLID